ncbi:unnamed protein product [Brachionus calyciflorus]|uniref:Transporter n=1 Tax=Brachionus calyciflorus TaxID=104777 RepID=A0A813MYM0_9BILA|nr:unnamed protein product [Brachionus calyciflorus]
MDNKSKIKRETWSGRFDFFLTSLGYAVGLGAIWRFPYLCYKYGGGAFLIPYFVFLFLVGIPLVFLEMAIGQFTSTGPMTCWSMVSIFRGIGFSVNIVNNYVNIYFTMILAYSMYYLIMSMNTELPWQYCNPKWIAKNCVDNRNRMNLTLLSCTDDLKCNDGLCYSSLTSTGSLASCDLNKTQLIEKGFWNLAYPSEIFWKEVLLQKSSSIDESGYIVWQLLVALTVAWLVITASVINGIKVSGKVVYFTSIFPYFVLLVLGIRGWMLEGAAEGIKFYIYPDFSKLTNLKVWVEAAAQIFFTLSISYGGLSALASYNDYKTNILRDSILVSIANCATSVFAGFVVFSYIGYLSKITGEDIDQVVQAGQGLAFVVYPFAVTTIKGSPIWSVLFFLMMLILGLDSSMGSVETFITSIFDLFPKFKKNRLRRYLSILTLIGIYFGLGILFCLQSGSYWIEIFDTYVGNWTVFLLGALESISIGWFYGFNNFRKDLSTMLGTKITDSIFFNIFRILWCFLTPVIVLFLMVVSILNYKVIESNGNKFPYWTFIVGNLITFSSLIGVVFWPIYLIITRVYIKKQPFRSLFKPDKNWRPLKDENKIMVDLAHGRLEKPSYYENQNLEFIENF